MGWSGWREIEAEKPLLGAGEMVGAGPGQGGRAAGLGDSWAGQGEWQKAPESDFEGQRAWMVVPLPGESKTGAGSQEKAVDSLWDKECVSC